MMVVLIAVVGLAVLLIAAALYDRTKKGRARRLGGGGVQTYDLRTDAMNQYPPPSDASGMNGGSSAF